MTLASMKTNLHTLSQSLTHSWGCERVVIEHSESTQSTACHCRKNLFVIIRDLFFRIFSCFASQSWKEENRRSLIYFYEVFGHKTITQCDKDWKLGLEDKFQQGKALTRRDVERLFVGLADIDLKRARRAFDAIVGDELPSNLLEKEARLHLRERLLGKEFEALTKEDWDALWAYMVPFERASDILLGQKPKIDVISVFLGGRFKQTSLRVYLQEKNKEEAPEDRMRLWELWMGKAACRAESHRLGTVVPHPHGYYAMTHRLVGGGARVELYQALTKTSDAFRHLVKFHPTRAEKFSKDSMLSWYNDVQDEAGTLGIQTVGPTVLYLLGRGKKPKNIRGIVVEGDPNKPICTDPNERHWGIGYSLGGTQVQLLATRVPKIFARITTIGALKVSKEAAEQFRYDQTTEQPITITHHIEDDDYTQTVGGASLGFGCEVEKGTLVETFVYTKKSKRKEVIKAALSPKLPKEFFTGMIKFWYALIFNHSRQSMLIPGYYGHRFTNLRGQDRRVLDALLGKALLEHVIREPGREARAFVDDAVEEAHRQLRIGANR